jgi:hypothetical protein
MFGTSMRDLLCGDLLAGTLKILQTIIQTLMIGFGYMLSYALIGDSLIPQIITDSKDLFLVQLVTSLVTSVTFAIILKTNRRHLINGGICGTLTFAAPDEDTFVLLRLARECMSVGGAMPAVLNAANEIAVAAFLKDSIGFCDIFDAVQHTVSALFGGASAHTLDEILDYDRKARALTQVYLETRD